MATVFICDRCRMEVAKLDDFKVITLADKNVKRELQAANLQPILEHGHWELCEKCANAVARFVTSAPPGDTDESNPEPTSI